MHILNQQKKLTMNQLFYHLLLIPLFLFGSIFTAFGQCDNDTTRPTAICTAGIDVSLSNGSVTLTPEHINESSFDDCTATENLVFRLQTMASFKEGVIPTSTAVTLQEEGVLQLVMWVVDEAGNSNNCFMYVNVVNKAPQCTDDTEAPELTCLSGLQTLQGGLIFGQDFVQYVSDNCSNEEDLTYSLELAANFTETMPSNQFIEFPVGGIFHVYVWVADSQGNTTFCKTKVIINEAMVVSGFVYNDANGNCSLGNGETGIKQLVKITLFEDNIVTYSSSAKGNEGKYTIQIPKPQAINARLEVSLESAVVTACQTVYTVDLSNNTGSGVTIPDIGVQLTQGCADLVVTTEAVQGGCSEESYQVIQFQNGGDVVANPSITVEFANNVLFTRVLSTHQHVYTYNSVEGNSYTFELKDLQPGEAGNIFIIGQQICDVADLTQVITATITDENACSNNWTGPEINITKKCLGDEVEFRIQNIGDEDMLAPSQLIVIEDVIMRTQNTFQLPAGDIETVRLPANGSTYHVTANQAANYPWQKMTTIVSEGCATDGLTISTGYVAQLPLENSAPHIDVAVKENKVVSYNRLDALPLGVGTDHLIAANTPIEYAIEYANNGEKEIANKLSIEVELAKDLDIKTLKVIYATHTEYELTKKENNIVEFVFPHIDLIHNSINAEEAGGLIKFTISQKADVPIGTKLESKVALQFNQNSPMTNSIFHTVGDITAMSTAVTDILKEEIKLIVYPNPFHQYTTFKIANPKGQLLDFELYNANGQLMHYRSFNQNSFNLQRNDLKNGFYFYIIKQEGQSVSAGKLLIE